MKYPSSRIAAAALCTAALFTDASSPRAGAQAPADVVIAPERQHLIGVTFEKARMTALRLNVRAVGTVAVPTRQRWELATRIDGYVEALRVSAPGERVVQGQAIADLYSPDVFATENELADLVRRRARLGSDPGNPARAANAHLLESARARLRLWSIPEAQIAALEAGGAVPRLLTLTADRDGVIESVAARQGQRAAAGDTLASFVDLSRVWVWTSFFQEDQPLLTDGAAVTVTSSAYPNEIHHGVVALIDPFMDAERRTLRVRIDLDNPEGRLRPGMYVDVDLESDQGDGLTVPVSAVLPTGRRHVLFVDKGDGHLEPRYVEVGRVYGQRWLILKGLAPGERVVTSANFLVDAESKLQGALKDW